VSLGLLNLALFIVKCRISKVIKVKTFISVKLYNRIVVKKISKHILLAWQFNVTAVSAELSSFDESVCDCECNNSCAVT